jgi:hypothetical protein
MIPLQQNIGHPNTKQWQRLFTLQNFEIKRTRTPLIHKSFSTHQYLCVAAVFISQFNLYLTPNIQVANRSIET